jgi:nucleotide-binding universal stress UspA family protein
MSKNYKHILIPLDGSKLAELALENGMNLAELSGADVTLLQVVQPAEHIIGLDTAHPIYLDQQWETQRGLAHDYLNGVHRRVNGKEIKIDTAVALGQAAETILDYTHDHPVDLIVMATHGRSGVQRWVFGSVAEKVLRGADVPVLLVRAHPE